ncbi:MAG: DUF58 domain-containing protein [Candidatus Geothermincolia bacterium]
MTKRALITILVGLALLLIAATIKSGWLYLVSSMLFSLVAVGLISGWLATRAVDVERQSPARVFEREPFEVVLRVINKGRTHRHLVTIRDMQFPGRKGRGYAARARAQREEFRGFMKTGEAPAVRHDNRDGGVRVVVVEDLPPRSPVEVSYELEAPRRGVYSPAEMRVSSNGIFGSAEIGHKEAVGNPLTVFPMIYPIDSFSFDPRADLAPVEPVEWSRKGIGQDYYGIREYVRGDMLRHIHWPSSARQGRLIVKEYEQELKPSVVLILALWEPEFGTADDNSLEDALRAAASITSYQESMGGLPLLVVPGKNGFEIQECSSLYGCLESLACFAPLPRNAGYAESLKSALETALESMLPGSALIPVTNAPPDSVAAAIEACGQVPGGSLVLAIDDSYGPRWSDEWLHDAPWLAGFIGLDMDLYAVTPGRGIGKCLREPLSTTAS